MDRALKEGIMYRIFAIFEFSNKDSNKVLSTKKKIPYFLPAVHCKYF